MKSSLSRFPRVRPTTSRAGFEAFMGSRTPSADLSYNVALNHYYHPEVQASWAAWQAAVQFKAHASAQRSAVQHAA